MKQYFKVLPCFSDTIGKCLQGKTSGVCVGLFEKSFILKKFKVGVRKVGKGAGSLSGKYSKTFPGGTIRSAP